MGMGFAAGLARQLAHPAGRTGRWLGNAMDIANRRPLRMAIDRLAITAGEDVLDAGCGTGAAMATLRRAHPASLTGVDQSDTMLAMARRSLGGDARLIPGDLAALPVEDGTIDAALALNTLYFDNDRHDFASELHRVLRPGGRVVAYVTHRSTMAKWSFTRAGLHRLYDAGTLRAAFVAGGFAADAIDVQEVAVTRAVRGLICLARRAS